MLDDDVDPALAAEKLIHPQFPRAARYDPVWQGRYGIGPNPLWFAESLSELLELTPGMRVLDLGCGHAISAIFLAKEFGVEVVAVDLTVDPDENRALIAEAGVESLVTAVQGDAHDLGFDAESFDAIVSLDAYQYFGTEESFLPGLLRVLKPGGRLGAVVLGLTAEFDDGIPEHLTQGSTPDLSEFHSPQWWSDLWKRSGMVDIEYADMLPDGWRHWVRWFELAGGSGHERWREYCARWAQRLEVDAGRTLGFPRIVARKTG
ncbi:methyltransferase family protein [Stackebrandtia albiflava]|uniref:Methyltransferase family protein n=1 Tax=Stackebrandtia albiflava TaxID=406432 RepID=A0A562VDV2_9ACTN|nr:methyltransferase domain-containing protein [Stackebrandtia albiflava]TWJ16066.1 methyltransferase family protein [Stackebrandtia albiflava]